MTYEQPSSLSFSIKESVWLNEGNEIEELLSLALEPDISIREADDQVYIRGSLLLFGEYRPAEDGRGKSDSYSDHVPFRSVEEVQMSDDGIGMIRHSFPLDVTIPRERINRLEDLYVTVDAFDYELPGRGCIELEANVSVSGIQNERSAEPTAVYQNDEEDTAFYTPPSESHKEEGEREERSFHFEAVREVTAADEEKEDTIHDSVYEGMGHTQDQQAEHTTAFEHRHNFNEQNYDEHNQYEEEANHRQEANTQYNEYDAEPDYEPEAEYEPEREPDYGATEFNPEPEWQHEPEMVRGEPTVTFSSQETPEEDEATFDENEGRDEETKTSSGKDENALYLTKMLTKGEEEYSRLRMCIVQDGESLESIAERYNIPVSNLIRMNRLNEERVAEGQILYIPVNQTPNSN
ncbi:MAG: stage VI sporulation protein D [Bacillus sp. (in: Bacteria)]|nr:stage VI sporulation protein D [Bacillus sp. (in: firmicutes)]